MPGSTTSRLQPLTSSTKKLIGLEAPIALLLGSPERELFGGKKGGRCSSDPFLTSGECQGYDWRELAGRTEKGPKTSVALIIGQGSWVGCRISGGGRIDTRVSPFVGVPFLGVPFKGILFYVGSKRSTPIFGNSILSRMSCIGLPAMLTQTSFPKNGAPYAAFHAHMA